MKILVTDSLSKSGIEDLKKAGHVVVEKKLSLKELIKEIPEYDCLIVRSSTRVTKEVIEAGKNLKIIGRAGVGYDNIDVKAASENGIIVKNAPHGSIESVAELTIALILALSRNIPQACETLKSGKWEKKKYKGYELYGKTLGIIGCGRIGLKVAEMAKNGFNMNVIGFDPNKKESIIPLVKMNELLKKSDYISLHVPKLKKPIIGSEELKKMKNTAHLINTSRGGNVDEKALYEALKNNWIAGAAFDVFENEGREGEKFENKLLELPNFIATSHLGASTFEAQERIAKEMAKVIIDFFKNGDLTNAVNINEVKAEFS